MGSRDELIDLGFKILNRVHRLVLHASGNRIGTRAFGMSAVELRSVGRRTGLVRSTMLTVPVEFDGSSCWSLRRVATIAIRLVSKRHG